VGKILNPQKPQEKKRKKGFKELLKKTNANPPLMLSKDGMIESLFAFIKRPPNFPRVFVRHFIQQIFFLRRGSGVEQGIPEMGKPLSFKFPLFYRRKTSSPKGHYCMQILYTRMCVCERERGAQFWLVRHELIN